MDRKPTYLRAWRKERGYSLAVLVGRLAELGVETTEASLSRIERGVQPYSQDILEALAEALSVTVAQLVEHNPAIPQTQVIDFVKKLSEKEARQAEAVLRAMFEKRA